MTKSTSIWTSITQRTKLKLVLLSVGVCILVLSSCSARTTQPGLVVSKHYRPAYHVPEKYSEIGYDGKMTIACCRMKLRPERWWLNIAVESKTSTNDFDYHKVSVNERVFMSWFIGSKCLLVRGGVKPARITPRPPKKEKITPLEAP